MGIHKDFGSSGMMAGTLSDSQNQSESPPTLKLTRLGANAEFEREINIKDIK